MQRKEAARKRVTVNLRQEGKIGGKRALNKKTGCIDRQLIKPRSKKVFLIVLRLGKRDQRSHANLFQQALLTDYVRGRSTPVQSAIGVVDK